MNDNQLLEELTQGQFINFINSFENGSLKTKEDDNTCYYLNQFDQIIAKRCKSPLSYYKSR